MLSAHENTTLTETGPDTAMGDVFRSYWQPALLAREVLPDGAPLRIKLLGEDFIAFRDTQGRVGIVEPRCSHRGANLFFGRNEECGLRCAYHGWKFDADGQCIDLPTAAPEVAEQLRAKAAIRALQVAEYGDIIWAYMGLGEAPPLPKFEFAELPSSQRFVAKKWQQCNWAQAVEGGLDTAHFSYLHAAIKNGEKTSLMGKMGSNEPPDIARFRWLIEDGAPKFSIMKHDAGLVLGAARQADEDQLYWRVTQFMMPNHSLAPNTFPGEMCQGNTWVPVSDESCWIFCFAYQLDRDLTQEERERFAAGHGIFASVDEQFVPLRNRDNDYLLDREVQRTSNFTGIEGISEQDAAIADSQGLIADRTREMLGQTDIGIVRFRQMMLEAAQEVSAGRLPHGCRNADAYLVRSGDAMSGQTSKLPEVLEARFGQHGGQHLQPC